MAKTYKATKSGAMHIANINKIRYRVYYYDTDTGFYYLQSRYYNPTWGRFINADGQLNDGLLGYNLFAYCGNNPINLFDPTGKFVLATLLIGIGVGALISSGINLANQVVAGNGINWRSVAASALSGGDRLISWSPPGSRWHFGGSAYWKVSSGVLGTFRFPY